MPSCCFRFRFPLPPSHFFPSSLPKAAISSNKTGPSWVGAVLRSFRQHKRVRVVCGAAVEEDRRQIQSSTLPKRTSGTLTRQHYSTASIHSTPPHHHHHHHLTPPTPLTPLLSPPPAPPPLALHTSASPTAPHCYGYRAKTARLLPESILKHEKVTLLLLLPPLAPRSFAIPQQSTLAHHLPSTPLERRLSIATSKLHPGSVHRGFVGPRFACNQIKSWRLPSALHG